MKDRYCSITKLSNCRIIDVEQGAVLPGMQDIYLKGRHILAIDNQSQNGLQADTAIDISGQFVIPGMINTHCHNTYVTPAIVADGSTIATTKRYADIQIRANMEKCIEYGITTLRDALSDNLTKIDSLKAAISAGELAGPRIFTSVLISHQKGACIQPSSMIGKLFMRLLGVPILDYGDEHTGVVLLPKDPKKADCEAAIDIAIQRGADFIKFYDQHEKMLTYKPGAEVLTNRELAECAGYGATIHRRSLMHHLTAESFAAGYLTGVNSLAHLPINRALTEEECVSFKKSVTMIEPTLSLAYYYCWKHSETKSKTIRLDNLSAYRAANYKTIIDKYWIEQLRPPVYRNFGKAMQQNFKSIGGFSMLPFFNYMDKYLSTGFDNIVQLLRYGCFDKICFGNDAGATQCSPATKDIEIDMLKVCCKEVGLNEKETNAFVLKVLTRNGAVALGKESELGCIKEGYLADFAVYSKNPLTDSDVLKEKTVMTVVDGRVHAMKGRHNGFSATT